MPSIVLPPERIAGRNAIPHTPLARRALALALLLALAPTANAATITVDSGADGTPAGVCTLRSAILANNISAPVGSCAAGSGTNTIVFAPAVSTVELTNGELRVEGSTALTLDGGTRNVVVRRATGAAPFRIINMVPSAELILRRITVSGGLTQSNNTPGAGIHATGPVTLVSSIVTGNTTTGPSSGGAGIHASGLVTLTDSTVSLNSTSGQISPGGGVRSTGTVNLLRSAVLNNTTQGRDSGGGGIRSGADVTMTRSQVTGNLTQGDLSSGGGVASSGVVRMTTSTVSNNTVRGRFDDVDGRYFPAGGGVYANGVVMHGSTISGNRAEGENANGGGIFTKYDVQLTNSTVSGNASAGDGGAIVAHTLTLTNSTVVSNATRKYGECGGLFLIEDPFLSNGPNTLNMRSSIVFGNSSQTVGNVCVSSRDPNGLTITGSHNLIGTTTAPVVRPAGTLNCNPALSVLGDHGGPTQTHRLDPSSCAINAGINAAGTEFDQRDTGYRRQIGPASDIGAFEFNDRIFEHGFDLPGG